MRTASPRSSLLTPVLAHPFVAQHAEQHVVLPAAVDAQIFARIALFAETGLEQQAAARPVMRQARRLDPMQLQALESEAEHQAEARAHIAAPGITLADPIPEAAPLPHPPPNIPDPHAPDHPPILPAQPETPE